MKVKELGHATLWVSDIGRSVAFYRDLLGLPEVGRLWGGRGVMFSTGRTHHELLLIESRLPAAGQRPDPAAGLQQRPPGLDHLGFKIGDSLEELKAAKAELEAAGVPIVGMADHGVSLSLYVLDPDGNQLDLYVDVHPQVWRQNPAAVAVPPKPLRLD
ncbi:MAG TPA: VOC family protein [Thermodesulfobacteriota bacterium]|nr:VOC family protein [Thermodesulfobacteriota bacterium]